MKVAGAMTRDVSTERILQEKFDETKPHGEDPGP